MNILMIGAHPDDCELRCAGLAAKYRRDGHRVRFLSMTDGSAGHHIQCRNEVASRRWAESRKAAAVLDIEYDVWNIADGELVCDLETRKRLIHYIRAFRPDVIFCHRTNDYHPDHRASGLLVQDASYMLIVPNVCPQTPALREVPVIMFFYDGFKNPSFTPDVLVDIDDVVEKKFEMLDCHVSQVYEWLPYTDGELERVPQDPAERFRWLHEEMVTHETTDEEVLHMSGYNRGFALAAALWRDRLIERYGEERGRRIRFAEAYAASEYGAPLDEQARARLFPY